MGIKHTTAGIKKAGVRHINDGIKQRWHKPVEDFGKKIPPENSGGVVFGHNAIWKKLQGIDCPDFWYFPV